MSEEGYITISEHRAKEKGGRARAGGRSKASKPAKPTVLRIHLGDHLLKVAVLDVGVGPHLGLHARPQEIKAPISKRLPVARCQFEQNGGGGSVMHLFTACTALGEESHPFAL